MVITYLEKYLHGCVAYHEGLIFLIRISISSFVWGLFLISSEILSAPWITVVWSRFPISLPIVARGTSAMVRQRYIAIWRGYTISLLRLCDVMSAGVIPKWSETVLMMSSGVTSLVSLGKMMSRRASSASAMLRSLCVNFANAVSLVSEPSSSRILDFMLLAIYSNISLGTLRFSDSCFCFTAFHAKTSLYPKR